MLEINKIRDKEKQMSWAERVRSSLERNETSSHSHVNEEDFEERVPENDTTASGYFPLMSRDPWTEVCSFLSYGEICKIKLVCRALQRLCKSEFIWKHQIQYLADEIRDARGNDSVDSLLLNSVERYTSFPERFRNLKRFFAKDIQREFHFREMLLQLIPSAPVQFEIQVLTSSTTRRILKSEIALYRHNGSRKATALLASSDTLGVGALASTIHEFTSEEDPDFLAKLLLGLSPFSTVTLLHQLGPRVRLLEVGQSEVIDVMSLQLPVAAARYATQVLEDFTVLPSTRFFVGPELCKEGRVGFVAVDAVRLLCLVARES